MNGNFIGGKEASKVLGVHISTLRKMDQDKQINVVRTPGGKRLYNVDEYISRNASISNGSSPKVSVCYCRVSTSGQKGDLQRQEDYLRSRYPKHQIISDIGSGINFKRKGLRTLLELAHRGELKEVVVAYKDRLCRIGYELLEWIFHTQSGAEIVVLNKNTDTKEQELTEDLLQILHVFSARSCGQRSYQRKKSAEQTIEIRNDDTNDETDPIVPE